jgi:hypothetical protein
MTNRIREVRCVNHRLDPAQVEVRVRVAVERLTPATEIRGRLMGPRCPYSTTVEVAYPWRELARLDEPAATARLILRAIIPEASLWDPQSPFLYQGPVELWQDGVRCDTVRLSHGLRAFSLGPRGLWVNGRLLAIRGQTCQHCTEADARRLHQASCNTLLAPVGPCSADLWDLADRYGFLMLGRLTRPDQLAQAAVLRGHASCLGWVLAADLSPDAALTAERQLLGVELRQPPTGPLPPEAAFVVCPEAVLPHLAELNLPILVQGQESPANGDGQGPMAAQPEVLGWIDSLEGRGPR